MKQRSGKIADTADRFSIRERELAQSQIQPPVDRGGGIASASHVGHSNGVFTAAVVKLFADITLLTFAAIAGYLVDVYLFGDDPTMENRESALWIPVLFVLTSVVLLKLLGSTQRSAHGFSFKGWAQTAAVISLAVLIVWCITEVTLSTQPNGEVAAAVWASAIVLIPIGLSAVGAFLRAKGIGCYRIVVVGDMENALPLMKRMERSGSYYRVVGMVSPESLGATATCYPECSAGELCTHFR